MCDLAWIRTSILGMTSKAKVAIVGAGVAGLCAAQQLIKDGIEAKDVLVVEALPRVGGRTQVLKLGEYHADVGAAWLAPRQREVWALAQELGLTIVEQNDTGGYRVAVSTSGGILGWLGRKVGVLSEEDIKLVAAGHMLLPYDLLCYKLLIRQMNQLAAAVIIDQERPWDSPEATKWDNLSVEEWLKTATSNTCARGMMAASMLSIFCQPLSRLSMLILLWSIAAQGSLEDFLEEGESHRILEGIGAMAPLLAEKLRKKGVRVVLGQRVVACEQAGRVHLTLEPFEDKEGMAERSVIKAERVIFTLPWPAYAKVKFKPDLPHFAPEAMRDGVVMGKVIKVVLAYSEKWWIASYALADPLTDHGTGNSNLVADVSPPGGKEYHLAVFFLAEEANRLSGAEQKEARLKEAINSAQRLMSPRPSRLEEKAMHPIASVEGDWPAVSTIRGGYSAEPTMGALTRRRIYTQMFEPQGRVFFAGTVTSEEWQGYVEGAILSGKRAAVHVVSSFRTISPYDDYDWDELPYNVQQAALDLGYNAKTWEADVEPAAVKKPFQRLSSKQQEAATILGYNVISLGPGVARLKSPTLVT
eukprot:g4283.t1